MKLWHKGACGDILYSWMYVQERNEPADYCVPRMGWYGIDQYHALYKLAMRQPYIKSFSELPHPWDALDLRHIVDTPTSRDTPTIIRPYFVDNGVEFPGHKPWIHNVDSLETSEPYCVINVTARYRTNLIWGTVLPAGEMRFIGTPIEFNEFRQELCRTGYEDAAKRLIYWPTHDLYEAAQVIKSARAFFGNASSCLALAQGLGVPNIIVEFDANTVNTCRFGHERHINAV